VQGVDSESTDETNPGDGPFRQGCGDCEDCRLVRAGSHPDLHLIYRQLIKYHDDPLVRKRKGLDLGVDVIRQFVIDRVGAKPSRGRAKVFLVREADRITPQAQNALLKTLEEPPETTFLILLVGSLDAMLPTTRSRCHQVAFAPLPADFVEAELTQRLPDLSAERRRFLARFSQGSLGLALQYAEDSLDQRNDELLTLLRSLPTQPTATAVDKLSAEAEILGEHYRRRDPEITETEAQRRGLKALLALASTWYRDVLHTAAGCRELIANAASLDRLEAAAGAATPDRAAGAIQTLATTETQLDANVNTKLCLDALVIRLARWAGA